MAAILRLRKIDWSATAVGTTNSLGQQRLHGSSPWCYWVKQALLEAGWVVYYSSDGLSALTSDLWTSSSFQAYVNQVPNLVANTTATIDGVWACLRSPQVDANGDYLHICLSPRVATWADPLAPGSDNNGQVGGALPPGAVVQVGGSYSTVLIGMTLSSSTMAFSGGAPAVAGNALTVLGALPTATGVTWTTHSLGQGRTPNSTTRLNVLTEGNQFTILKYQNYTTSFFQNFISVVSLQQGGYAIITNGHQYNGANAGATYDGQCLGGFYWHDSAGTAPQLFHKQLGGFRTAFIKRIDGTVVGGGLDVPTPKGYPAWILQPYLTNQTVYPTVTHLRAHGVENPAHYDLGPMSDMVLLGGDPLTHNDRLISADPTEVWFVLKFNSYAYLVKWDYTDYPLNEVAKLPPG